MVGITSSGSRNGREWNEQDAIGEQVAHGCRDLDREASLADATRAGQGHERHIGAGASNASDGGDFRSRARSGACGAAAIVG